MSEPFLGEIRLFPYNFAPRNWAFCRGQLMSISQNTALFSLLGTTYGGNGQTTFALPDLQGKVAMSSGQSPGFSPYALGQVAGAESVTLTSLQMPQHVHPFAVPVTTEDATLKNPAGNVPASTGTSIYGPAGGGQGGAPTTTGVAGGSQPHPNMQPYLVLNYCIALQGIFPSRN